MLSNDLFILSDCETEFHLNSTIFAQKHFGEKKKHFAIVKYKQPSSIISFPYLAVALGVDVDDVVSAVVVAAVHQDGVQDVRRRVLLVGVLQVLIQTQALRELKPTVQQG